MKKEKKRKIILGILFLLSYFTVFRYAYLDYPLPEEVSNTTVDSGGFWAMIASLAVTLVAHAIIFFGNMNKEKKHPAVPQH